MKSISTLAAGTAVVAATLANANPAPSPVQVEARQASTSASALPQVTVKGNAFYAGNDRFYIRGIDYQPGGSSDAADPLANVANCQRDVKYFQQLGINTLRVYTVDNTANHDECMAELANAGIYLALDVNTPKYSLNRANPGPSYNPTYLQSIFATMDVFSKYDNTLLFFNGNEVINDPTNTGAAPFVKAVGRDMKQYRVSRGLRAIPIGYSAADVESNRYQTAEYFNCGTDDQRSDFFAFNDYSWCDPTTYQGSQWQQKVEQYGNYTLPLFLSEYGCIKNTRDFGEVAPLYSQMTPVYSGGLVYEYSEESDNPGYGLVTINGDSVTPKADFTALQNAFKNSPPPSGDGGAKASGPAMDCPAASSDWNVTAYPGSSLPATPSGAVAYFKNGAGAGPGLTGDGSQDAPGGSTATASAGSGSATAYVTGASATSTSTASKGAAPGLRPEPMGYGALATVAVVFVSGLLGTALL